MDSYNKNATASPGNRYNDKLSQFCMYLRLIMGNVAYNALVLNMGGAIPVGRTLASKMDAVFHRYQEGIEL